jgi:hypothetical protein
MSDSNRAKLIARLATASNTIITMQQAVASGNAILKKAHDEGREVSKEELDAVFGEDDADMAALDAKLKALGA